MSNLEYQYQCGGCVYYDFQGDYKKGYCSWYRSYYYPGDNKYEQAMYEYNKKIKGE